MMGDGRTGRKIQNVSESLNKVDPVVKQAMVCAKGGTPEALLPILL